MVPASFLHRHAHDEIDLNLTIHRLACSMTNVTVAVDSGSGPLAPSSGMELQYGAIRGFQFENKISDETLVRLGCEREA